VNVFFDAVKTFWYSLVSVFATIKPNDILDIIIVAFVVYKVIQLVKETRAAQIVKGIALLALSYLLSQMLSLRAFSFILLNVLQNGVLVLFVVFQPELRRAFEQMGRSRIKGFNFFNISEGENIEELNRKRLEHIVDAVVRMSYKRIGALIVIERETKLNEIAKTGTQINASISSELIENIFFPKAPLHDGAILIRDRTIIAAGCILPLTGNMGLSHEIGTRHRAAVGMSENSDAVSIVVSEETGAISLAIKGELKRGLNSTQLTESLYNEIEKSNKPAKEKFMNKIKFKKGDNNEH
jgi:diadenylate cyclase